MREETPVRLYGVDHATWASIMGDASCGSTKPASTVASSAANTFIGSSRPRIDTFVCVSSSGEMPDILQTSSDTMIVQLSVLVMS